MKIFLMGEDSVHTSPEVLENLIIKTLHAIETSFNVHDDNFDIKFSRYFGSIIQGNMWRQSPSPKIFDELCGFIATIYKNDDEFIFWHIDADKVWIEGSELMISDNIIQFHEKIITKIENICGANNFNLQDFLKKIILVVPFYSIESWLYESFEKINISHPMQHEVLKNLRLRNSNKFDIIFQIRRSNSVQDSLNNELSKHISTTKLDRLEMSYSLFLRNLKQNDVLLSALPKFI